MKLIRPLAVRSAQSLKSEPHFQLSRVVTTDGERLVVKCSPAEYPSEAEEALLEQEFRFLSEFASRRTLKPVALCRFGVKLAACFEDVDGRALSPDVLGGSLRLPRLAAIVRDLCGVLGEFHRRGLVLVGLTPGTAILGEHDRAILSDALIVQPIGLTAGIDAWLEPAYLPYLAPEVVARAPLLIDERADLYALGVVIYQLMCRELPFAGADPGRLIQSHLARQPDLPTQHDPSIPVELSRLVMKLLAKDPAERFASVAEFEREFTRQADPAARTSVWEAEVEDRQSPARLAFPGELFGREQTTKELVQRIESPRLRAELLVVEGETGIGKTALAHAVGVSAGRKRGLAFCSGKFSQTHSPSPLSGWASCLSDLARGVLMTSSAGELQEWRSKVSARLGANAPWIATLVPEWAIILGMRPMASGSMLDSGLERLALALRALLGCFAKDGAPMVVVLDDVQWADASSLKILELFLSASDPLNVVVLALLRTRTEGGAEFDEVKRGITAAGGRLSTLTLEPLHTADIAALLHETFRDGLDKGQELAEATLGKTGGNPFFVREFLSILVRQQIVTWSSEAEAWRWDTSRLRALPLTENVVTLLTGKIESLPAEVKEVLQVAAVLGPEFALGDLCAVQGVSAETAEALLGRATEEGLLASVGWSDQEAEASDASGDLRTTHVFVHDRVFETCLGLMSRSEREELHLRVGRTLASGSASVERGSYRVAAHFNVAHRLVLDQEELLVCAERNLSAGREAKRKGAFSQALEFLEFGLGFLARAFADAAADSMPSQRAWHERFELSLALHEEGAEAAYLSGRLGLMHDWCDRIAKHVKTPLAKVAVYDIRISGLKAAKRFSDAVSVALEILGELGVRFPKRPHMGHVLFGFLWTRRKLPTSAAKLGQLPRMTDARVTAIARIIQSVYPAAYLGRPELFPLLVYRHVEDALEHGNSDYSGVTYNAFAAVFCAMGKFDVADDLGRVGLELVRQQETSRHRARAYSVYYFLIYPWQHALWTAVPHYIEGIREGIAHGDFEFACYLMTFESLARLHSGESLLELRDLLVRYRDRIRDLGQERSILMQSILCQLVSDLREGAAEQPALVGEFYDEVALLPRCLDPLDENLVFHNYLAKVIEHVYFARWDAARVAASEGRKVLRGGAFGNYLGGIFVFYAALAELRGAPGRGAVRRARRDLRKLQRWARGAPSTFLHKAHLLAAESARARGAHQEAAAEFERAIELAVSHGAIHEAGLAQAQAAAFYVERGMPGLAQHYLREARHSFKRWGAAALVRRLEADYEEQFVYLGTESEAPRLAPISSSRESLDYRTLIKSSQALSGETLQTRLMERLLETMVEHAGCQRAVLMLERDGRLYMESELDVNEPKRESTIVDVADAEERLALTVVRYAARTRETVVLSDATRSDSFSLDPYLSKQRTRSLLCVPLLHQGRLLGLVYLENDEVSHLFSPSRIEMVNLLASQAAISIANVRFHDLQLEANQAKINPHFLFNALSSIADLTVTDGATAERAVIQLAALYRYILTSFKEPLVTLEQELQIVRSYLELEKLRYGTKLQFVVEHRGDPGTVRIPALIIQPLVENCIRHGIAPKVQGGRVSVVAQVDAERCWILVEDDGDGPSKASAGTGFGLKSIRERLMIAYGDRFSFSVTQRLGCRVEIEIPLGQSLPEHRSSLRGVSGLPQSTDRRNPASEE